MEETGRPNHKKSLHRSVQALLDDPYGTRTRVTAVKGRCPRPLDEGAAVRPV